MAMNFYEHQDAARKRTGRLVVLFVLAVICIIACVYLAVVLALQAGAQQVEGHQIAVPLWNPPVLFVSTLGVLSVVILGSLYKIAELRAGGEAVARSLGGRLLDPDTRVFAERRLLNVVEEMAIASGTPVPQVYLLDEEQAINAFAAGYEPGNAVIGVTHGCMTKLTRDELQGVIAHEFSHILNGDMRLNIRLMGIVHGILVLGILGWWLFRIALHSDSGRRRNDRDGKAAVPMVVLGLILCVVGFVGVFFGRLIKAAVSRQREFLADSSAVQFTRNPGGIAGALAKIGGFSRDARIENPHAEEASHMFFGNALKASFLGAMATHPPLPERIRRIQPSFDGHFPDTDSLGNVAEEEGRVSGLAGRAPAGKRQQATNVDVTDPAAVADSVGAPTPAQIAYAEALHRSIPDAVANPMRSPFGARAVIFALLLNREQEPRRKQLARLAGHADKQVYRLLEQLHQEVADLGAAYRLPLADLCVPALKTLSPAQYASFRANVQFLIEADERIELFEYALQHILTRNLDTFFSPIKPPRIRYRSLQPLAKECGLLLSALAAVGQSDAKSATAAFNAGVACLGQAGASLQWQAAADLGAIDRALAELNLASFAIRRMVLVACITCVAHDRRVSTEEAELLRSVADAIGCPLAPFLPGQQI